MEQWELREIARFLTGEYKEVPKLRTLRNCQFNHKHYLHMSTETASDMVAYTPSDEYGIRNRKVAAKFGRYIKAHVTDKDGGVLIDSTVSAGIDEFRRRLAGKDDDNMVAVVRDEYALHFTTDKDVIDCIFETELYAEGSTHASCMWGRFDDWKVRPYHVYADSPDVAVAYLTCTPAEGDGSRMVARSVVSVKDKRWVRIYAEYGDGKVIEKFKDLLDAAGYTKGPLYNNRLSHVGMRGGDPILPYLDGNYQEVSERDGYWLVVEDGDGEYVCDRTDGIGCQSGDRCGCCDELTDNCECSYCECCGRNYADGCERCNICEYCESCREHGGCDCNYCSECDCRVGARYGGCQCDRCDICEQLVDDCDCEPDPDTKEDYE